MSAKRFRQKSGLTQYAFACGYVQRVGDYINQRDTVDLYLDAGCWHVKARKNGELIEWVAETYLSDARDQWDKRIKVVFADKLKTAQQKIRKNKYKVIYKPEFMEGRDFISPWSIVVSEYETILDFETKAAAMIYIAENL